MLMRRQTNGKIFLAAMDILGTTTTHALMTPLNGCRNNPLNGIGLIRNCLSTAEWQMAGGLPRAPPRRPPWSRQGSVPV